MKELSEIVGAFESLCGQQKPAALATVIAVGGSAYRRPGARMLVAEDGRTWGGVSGGCLERDVARRARGVIATGRSIVCRYDTTDDEDLATGVATGCRGTVDLFIEPLSPERPGPFPWLARALRRRQPVRLATIIKTSPDGVASPGDRLAAESGDIDECDLHPLLTPLISQFRWTEGRGSVERFDVGAGWADVFLETVSPPQSLIIFGAGPDVLPVTSIARTLGWHVTVVASRPAAGAAARFAAADVLCVTSADHPTEGVDVTPGSAVVLMTHNYPRDVAILSELSLPVRYLGILGPRTRTDELLAGLAGGGRLVDVRAPVGLDLGAETAEEIALSIVAEIQAVLRGSSGIALRDRPGPIHLGQNAGITEGVRDLALRSLLCPM